MPIAASFRWYFAGRSISLAGSAMSPVALAFGVLALTGSAFWVAAVTGTAMVATVATMLVGGGIADRYRRSTVLSLTSLGAGLTQAGVALLLITHQHPVLLLPFAVGNGVFQGLTTPVLRGILSNLASGRGLQRASSLLASANNLARILGPTAAGLLTASVGGGWAIAADAASFLLAAACFARIAIPDPPHRAGGRTMVGDLREGWTYFSSHPWFWSVTLAFAVFNATNRGVWAVLGPVIAFHTIGPAGWGLVLSALGVGALLASLVLVRVSLLRRPMPLALATMALGALPLILLGAGAGLLWLAAASFLAGVATELFTVTWETVNLTHIPERLLSRVGAHDEFWSFVSFPLGQTAAPVLAAVIGAAPVALTGGTIAALTMLVVAALPMFRRIELHHSDH
ncbi:MFS transporter [Dactylosporangium sp. CS-033363]|uniref:MFS transporter n=1 Tax=Dactylosporangium sp. CS-033363 TaxID=3239935 RepID=UPI003D8D59AA